MKPTESDENIYNSLPVELFTNEFEDELLGEDFDSDDKDFAPTELVTDFRDLTRSRSPEIPQEDLAKLSLSDDFIAKSPEIVEFPELKRVNEEISAAINAPIVPSRAHSVGPDTSRIQEESAGLWIRCTRCGKKNDLDCNFCGKCGLQIHRVVSIAEPEAEATIDDPEVVRNMKYHYKRPVFCFGPRGNCFASFSSPSKSVRNVVKFRLSTLPEFKAFLEKLIGQQIISQEYDRLWNEEEFKNANWTYREGFLRTLASILSGQSGFILDSSLRQSLLDFFSSIAPADLGSIKNLAVQDTIRYSRPDIDEIFHKLVLGRIKEACDQCIEFNYWDHALIIAKTLDVNFYEDVMNRFLNARFANGHPLRTLYLIMTNNEQSALEEIRSIIDGKDTVMFVQEIWPVLGNFLLRTKPNTPNICNIFEDIGNCLFEQKLFENALICYIVAVLSGAKFDPKCQLVNRLDYLLTWSLQYPEHGSMSFVGMRIVDLISEKLSSVHSETILWRSQFAKLLFTQYLYDMDVFDSSSLLSMTKARKAPKTGYSKLLSEQCTIICARQLVEESETFRNNTPKVVPFSQPSTTTVQSPTALSPAFPITNPMASPAVQGFNPVVGSGGYEPVQDFAPAPPMASGGLASSISPSSSSSSSSSLAQPEFTAAVSRPASTNSRATEDDSSQSKQHSTDKQSATGEKSLISKWKLWGKGSDSGAKGDKPVVAKMGKKNTWRYDEKLKKWVDDNDPSTMQEPEKIAPPPVSKAMMAGPSAMGNPAAPPTVASFRAVKKGGKVKYFDPLNPDSNNSSDTASSQPVIPSFNGL